MYTWTSTDKILSVGFDLDNQELRDLKDWFHANWPNNFNLPPHIGLIMLPLHEEKYKEAFKLAYEFIHNWQPPKTTIQQVIFDTNRDKETFVKLQLDKSWLADQHNQLLDTLTKLRPNGLVRYKDIERINAGKYSHEELDVLFLSGFIRSRQFFDSHITLGLIAKEFWSNQLERQITEKISHFISHSIEINNVHVIYHTSTSKQSDTQVIDRVDIHL